MTDSINNNNSSLYLMIDLVVFLLLLNKWKLVQKLNIVEIKKKKNRSCE